MENEKDLAAELAEKHDVSPLVGKVLAGHEGKILKALAEEIVKLKDAKKK